MSQTLNIDPHFPGEVAKKINHGKNPCFIPSFIIKYKNMEVEKWMN